MRCPALPEFGFAFATTLIDATTARKLTHNDSSCDKTAGTGRCQQPLGRLATVASPAVLLWRSHLSREMPSAGNLRACPAVNAHRMKRGVISDRRDLSCRPPEVGQSFEPGRQQCRALQRTTPPAANPAVAMAASHGQPAKAAHLGQLPQPALQGSTTHAHGRTLFFFQTHAPAPTGAHLCGGALHLLLQRVGHYLGALLGALRGQGVQRWACCAAHMKPERHARQPAPPSRQTIAAWAASPVISTN